MKIIVSKNKAQIFNDNYLGKTTFFRLIFIFVLGLSYFIFREASVLLIGAYVLAFFLIVGGSMYLNKMGVPKINYTIEYEQDSKTYKIKNHITLVNLPFNNKIIKSDIKYLDWYKRPLYESLTIKTKKENLKYPLNGNSRNLNYRKDEVDKLAAFLGSNLKNRN